MRYICHLFLICICCVLALLRNRRLYRFTLFMCFSVLSGRCCFLAGFRMRRGAGFDVSGMQGGAIDLLVRFIKESVFFSLLYAWHAFLRHNSAIFYYIIASCAIFIHVLLWICTIKRIVKCISKKCFICAYYSRSHVTLFQCNACAAPVWPGFARTVEGVPLSDWRWREWGNAPRATTGQWRAVVALKANGPPPHFYTVAKFDIQKTVKAQRTFEKRHAKLCNANACVCMGRTRFKAKATMQLECGRLFGFLTYQWSVTLTVTVY